MIVDPVDPVQCQTLIHNGCTFMSLGGKPGYDRCTAGAKYIINELEKGEDGQYGAMSICIECKDKFITQVGEKLKNYVISEILR